MTDPSQLPANGADLIFNMSSGPYKIEPNDTLTFYTAIIAGNDLDDFYNSYEQAKNTVKADFELPKAPANPVLTGIPSDQKNILYWDNKAELSVDSFSGEMDFEGYRIYRSMDRGINWDQIADYDKINSIGANSGIQYSYIDSTVSERY
ncbi:MAG: hypothetical protein U5K00_00420 [Melioribacteraceae bacterium]|nr:hypothetical protein [Melioribacteraceae bacterium]